MELLFLVGPAGVQAYLVLLMLRVWVAACTESQSVCHLDSGGGAQRMRLCRASILGEPCRRHGESDSPPSVGRATKFQEVPVVAVTSWGFQGGSWQSSIIAGMAVTVPSAGPPLEPLVPSIRVIVSCRCRTSSIRYYISVEAGWANGSYWRVGLASPASTWSM